MTFIEIDLVDDYTHIELLADYEKYQGTYRQTHTTMALLSLVPRCYYYQYLTGAEEVVVTVRAISTEPEEELFLNVYTPGTRLY